MIDIDTNKEKRTIMGISFDSDKKMRFSRFSGVFMKSAIGNIVETKKQHANF